MNAFVDKIFGFDSQKHNVRTEIMAGITTFLTMAYILAVNPAIFSALPGMPGGSVFTATALAAIVGTLVMALYAKKPFALAPGMGLNAFFVYTVCLGMGYTCIARGSHLHHPYSNKGAQPVAEGYPRHA